MDSVRYLDPPLAPRPLDAPPVRGRVLIVAPHADDEVIGPGGTALLHRRLGDPVHILVLTDGTSGATDPDQSPADIRSLREAESRSAADRLGAASLEFLRFPDGARAREEDLGAVVPVLRQRLEALAPDVVYAPHPGEIHRDHHVTAVALQRALAFLPHPPAAFGYEIWSTLEPSVVVDISEVMEQKLELVRCFPSQLANTDIVHFFSGINAYRAVYLPKGARFGEAFCKMPPDAGAR